MAGMPPAPMSGQYLWKHCCSASSSVTAVGVDILRSSTTQVALSALHCASIELRALQLKSPRRSAPARSTSPPSDSEAEPSESNGDSPRQPEKSRNVANTYRMCPSVADSKAGLQVGATGLGALLAAGGIAVR